MGKLISLLVIASMGCKLLFGRWPWQMLALPQASRQMSQARTLLGVNVGASRADIIEAHKRLLVQVHPDRGGSEALVYEANAARDLLLARMSVPRA
ncbi:MAG: molecular chaperone DnaJ [Pseudomonadota bacterium]|nr:molecular chaperone DnaJ [Pseudomonadota bacterium]